MNHVLEWEAVENKPLYHSPRGLYPFQEDGIAHCYFQMGKGGGILSVWDTGIGKSHLAMGLACLLVEDDLVDHVLLVAERQKIADDEWPSDWKKFTELIALRHHGTGRMKRLEKNGVPQVIMTTYETGKADLGKFITVPGDRGKSIIDGPLMTLLRGKRVLVIFDEISGKLKNRTSDNYKVWKRTLDHLRKANTTRILGLTATPIEKDYEDAFNVLRLISPPHMPLVGEFEKYFVRSRDNYDRPRFHEDRMPEFAEMAAPLIIKKRKTDPDIIDQFPKQIEESRWFDMADDQRELYEFICDLQDPEEPPLPGLSTIKRMAAGYPASIVHSAIHGKSQLARLLVEELGADYLESVSSVKARGLQEYLEPLVLGQGAKALVFSFFGPSILPLLKRDLEQRKIKVYTTHGGLSLAEVDRQRGMFKADREACVLLSSDAGARGINIPQATYVTEYEGALTFANRTQRINRVHRIDSDAPSVTAMTFIVRHSVEAALADACMDRNDQHDTLLAQDILTAEQSTEAIENYVTAAERRSALEIYRNPRKRLHQPKERSA